MNRPLCFVLMPFGTKPDGFGGTINFEAVYTQLIVPALEAVGFEPLRAGKEQVGVSHKSLFEPLTLCEYVVADLTTSDAQVFYGLGIRHALRSPNTVLLVAEETRLPFNLAPVEPVFYRVSPRGEPADVEAIRAVLQQRLEHAHDTVPGRPIYKVVDDFSGIKRLKTDVFRDRVKYSVVIKARLAEARRQGPEAVRAVEETLDPLNDQEAGVVVDLLLSYRATKAWKDMIALVAKMPPTLIGTVMVQEQLAFALNRMGLRDQAEKVLLGLLEKRGSSSETYGLLGRVYKDRWQDALKRGEPSLAQDFLKKAIVAYRTGFETDWRDAYPGVNAVTLMEISDPPDPHRKELVPVISYAVKRRIEAGQPDYWDHATRLELAVLAKDRHVAFDALANARAIIREPWEPETTVRNLRLIREARAERSEEVPWALEIEEALLAHA